MLPCTAQVGVVGGLVDSSHFGLQRGLGRLVDPSLLVRAPWYGVTMEFSRRPPVCRYGTPIGLPDLEVSRLLGCVWVKEPP